MPEQKRPPGRPKGGSVFDRSQIIDAALEALASGGYAALTMRGVARSIGASHATVQRHFATKDELWRGAIDAFLASFEAPVELSSTAALRDGIEEILTRGSVRPGLMTSWLHDRSPGHGERFDYLAKRLVERHQALYEIITRWQEAGSLRQFDAGALLLLLNIGVGAIASAPTATREIYGFDLDMPDDRARLADAISELLVVGPDR